MGRRKGSKNLRVIRKALTMIICVRAFLSGTESSMAEAAEQGAEAVPPRITWEDHQNDGETGPVVLHFSFYDGTAVDKEVPYYPSTVEKTEYRDITGDGRSEALVYRYFANTATEYTLIDVFEIKDGTVDCISPQTELSGLADNVWNVTVIEDRVAGNPAPVLRMESYDKENGMVFRGETVLVVYGVDGWQIYKRRSWKLRCTAGELVSVFMENAEEENEEDGEKQDQSGLSCKDIYQK